MFGAASSSGTSPATLHVYMQVYIRDNADVVCYWGVGWALDVGNKTQVVEWRASVSDLI